MPQPVAGQPRTNPSEATLLGFHVNVKAFGAAGDGIQDDTAEIQAAVDSLASTGGTLFFPPGTYLVSSPGIVLPGVPSIETRMHILGYGATIKATTAISMMKRAFPSDMTDAVNRMSLHFTVEGLRFAGDGDAGQVGLDMVATYGLVVRDCYFDTCDTGLRITFGLLSKVESCIAKTCVSYGFHVRSGAGPLWSGASVSNSGSNHTILRDCRSYASSGELAQFYIRGCSGVRIEDCITEGANPVNGIDWDVDGATVIKYFEVRNLHSENSPSGAVIKTVDNGGSVIIDGLWHQPINCTLIAATGTSSLLHVRALSWASGSKLKHRDASSTSGEPIWVFHDGIGNTRGEDVDPFNTGNWISGIVPKYMHVERLTQIIGTRGSQIYPSDGFMGINGQLEMSKVGSYIQFTENGTADALAASSNTGRLYVRDNGAGKTQLCVRFATGAVQVIATEP